MARLSSTWWKKTRPVNFRGVILKCIGDFESAVKTKNVAKIYDEIENLSMAIQMDRTLLRKHLKTNPVKLKSIMAELDDLDTLIVREEKSLAKNGASEIKVWSRDFGEAISNSFNQKLIQFGGGVVELKLDLATIHAIENIGAEARLFRELSDLFDDEVKIVCNKIEDTRKQQYGLPLTKQQRFSLGGLSQKRMKVLKTNVVKAANGAAAKAAAQHKASKAYKKKKTVDVTVASLSVIGSAAGVALPGTTAVAAVVLVRSVAALSQEIVSISLTLEQHYKRVLINIKALQTSYDKGNRSAKEVAKTTVNSVLNADVMTTHSSCMTHFEEYIGTLNVLADRVRMQQKDIIKTIRKLDALAKVMDKLAVDAGRYKKSSVARKIASAQKSLDKTLDKASDTMSRIVKAEKSANPLAVQLLKLGDNSKAVKIAEKVIPFCVNLAFAIGSFGDGVNASKEAATVTVGVVGLLVDVQGEVTDLFG